MVIRSSSWTLLAYRCSNGGLSYWCRYYDLNTQHRSAILQHDFTLLWSIRWPQRKLLPKLIFQILSYDLTLRKIQISWETTVVPRPRTKRAALIAIANCVSSVSHWFTPYFFLRSQEPRYQTGGGVIIIGCGVSIFLCFATKWYCQKKNKVLEETERLNGEPKGWRFAS